MLKIRLDGLGGGARTGPGTKILGGRGQTAVGHPGPLTGPSSRSNSSLVFINLYSLNTLWFEEFVKSWVFPWCKFRQLRIGESSHAAAVVAPLAWGSEETCTFATLSLMRNR